MQRVRSQPKPREGLERESEGDAEIIRTGGRFTNAEGERRGPASHIAIEGIALFLHATLAQVIALVSAKSPVLVKFVQKTVENQIVALAKSGGDRSKIIAQIIMGDGPAPEIARLDRQGMKGQGEITVRDIITDQRLECEPRARAQDQIRKDVRKSGLVALRANPPIRVEVPVRYVNDLAPPLGLEFVMQAGTKDVLTVNGVNGIVIGKIDGKQPQRGKFVIELRRHVGAGLLWFGNINIIRRRLDDMAESIDLEEFALGLRPQAR